ncbi:hypothetical protein MTO96_030914 [Rhipicephalus appendiculatus]
MDVGKMLKLVATLVAVTASAGQDCQQSPQDCNAMRLLSNITSFNTYATSSPAPRKFCPRYDRTSISEDGRTVEYNLVYTNSTESDDPINDTATFQIADNVTIDVTIGSNPGIIDQLTLDFVIENQCFVGHCNCTETPEYYLFNNADSNFDDYSQCLQKLDEYANGNVTILRSQMSCPTIPPKP